VTFEFSAAHPVLVAVGTRPEAIKLSPVVEALARRGVPTFLLSTGQHHEMLAQTLAALGLEPDRDLALMRPDQSLAALSASLLTAADALLAEVEPSWVVVQGDTTTVAMVALAAFYRGLRVAHVEAGLRTGDRRDPFPEEMNRTLLGHLADLHLAPTPKAREHLLAQGVDPAAVRVVGNTVIDALFAMRERVRDRPLADFGLGFDLPAGRRLVLVTLHRRESFGAGLRAVCRGLRRLAEEMAGEVEIVYPVHLNPNVREAAGEVLAGVPGVRLVEPLDYAAFVKLLTSATLVVTDSGGVQEEAAALGIPLLVTRRTSERPEALDAGVAELVGTDPDRLATTARRLLTDPALYAERAVPTDAFGDGRAGERIAELLLG
jgi:UDP-N-acetylglucosamine 2-epimerase